MVNWGNQNKAQPSNVQSHHRRDVSPRDEAHHNQSRETDLQNTFWTEGDHFLGIWGRLWDAKEEWFGISQDLL